MIASHTVAYKYTLRITNARGYLNHGMLCYFYAFVTITYTDAKPELYDLLCMSYTSEDEKIVDFMLMDRIEPRVKKMAIALRFPQHAIAKLKNNDGDSVYYLLSEWLRGGNKDNDSRPLSWGTLITALQHAGLVEEVRILEDHFVEPVAQKKTSTCSFLMMAA